MKNHSIEDQIEQLSQEKRAVSYDSYDISVRQIIDMVESGDIDISPEYQRHFVWDEKRSSELVESIFLGIPVPSLYMATNKDATWEVIDGVQRISTILHFCGSKELLDKIKKPSNLILTDLEKLSTFVGTAYQNMPKSMQLQFMMRPLRVTTLNDKSDSLVRYDLFERLNTGAVKLHPQEIRNCVFRGEFTDRIRLLSRNTSFRRVVKLPANEVQAATYEECVLRFFAFLLNYKKFSHSVVGFLNEYIASANKKLPSDDDIKLFSTTMSYLAQELPHGIVRKEKGKTPLNLYEAITVGSALAIKSGNLNAGRRIIRFIDNDELVRSTTGATNSRTKVANRIEFVRDKLVA